MGSSGVSTDASPAMSEMGTVDMKLADGNGWLLQETTTRLPGREWED